MTHETEQTAAKCDFCSKQTEELRGTPDIPAKICRECWNNTPVEIGFDDETTNN